MRVSRFLLPLAALFAFGFAAPPLKVTVRFFAEANARDGASFSSPIKLGNPPRDAFLEKLPIIHERQIKAIYPFRAPDGSWGCAFRLDNEGQINLDAVSTERRGTYLVCFIGTKKGEHRVADMLIDRTVSDAVIAVPKGLTDIEIALLSKEFKVIGHTEVPNVPLPRAERSWNPFHQKEAAPAS